jgi:hypothetical protein
MDLWIYGLMGLRRVNSCFRFLFWGFCIFWIVFGLGNFVMGIGNSEIVYLFIYLAGFFTLWNFFYTNVTMTR